MLQNLPMINLNRVKNFFTPHRVRNILYVFYGLLVIATVYHAVFAKRIIPGVYVGKVRVGGMTFLEAKKTLEDYEKKVTKELVIKSGDKEYIIKASDIGLVYDWDSSVTRAFEVGRTGNIFIDNKDKLAGLFRGLFVAAFYDYDDELAGAKFSLIKADANTEAKNAGLAFDKDGNLVITPAVEGVKVVDELLHKAFTSSFDRIDFSQKTLPTKNVKTKVSEADLQASLPEIKKIITNEITVRDGNKSWKLDKTQLLDLLKFTKNGKLEFMLDEPKFEAFSDSVAQDVNELPRGQVMGMNEKKVTAFKLIRDGKELDQKEFAKRFKDAFFNAKSTVELPMSTVSGLADKEKYGILALLGEGVSTYKGSGAGRIHNLTLAAERTNGVLVAPGAIYSMNNSIGEVEASTGYDIAYIIQEGRTVLGSGGGVCQTSTTIFRAVLNAGLPVVVRHPHAYRVSYYEQNMPVGFDAAVFQPSWDFQFKNDTPNYVLVQSSYNLEESSLTFRIFGTPDGRTVEITEPVVTNQSPPPPALYQDDPTLPKGATKQIDFPAWGASVKFTRTVKMAGKVLFEDTYNSRYQPWRAIYLVGTKQ
jgi:vancomycin resistance protein YoaR